MHRWHPEWSPHAAIVTSMLLMPFAANHSGVALPGARPEPLSAIIGMPGLWISAKQSPPMPVMAGSTTHISAVAVIAASMALPPRFRHSIAASDAAGCDVATIALRAMTGERPGK